MQFIKKQKSLKNLIKLIVKEIYPNTSFENKNNTFILFLYLETNIQKQIYILIAAFQLIQAPNNFLI